MSRIYIVDVIFDLTSNHLFIFFLFLEERESEEKMGEEVQRRIVGRR